MNMVVNLYARELLWLQIITLYFQGLIVYSKIESKITHKKKGGEKNMAAIIKFKKREPLSFEEIENIFHSVLEEEKWREPFYEIVYRIFILVAKYDRMDSETEFEVRRALKDYSIIPEAKEKCSQILDIIIKK